MEHLLRGGSQVTDELLEDARAYGVILPEHLEQETDFVLWAEHRPAVELFLRCMTQWRVGADGVVGLDYGVVLAMAKLYEVPELPRVMEDLQVMELKARELINKKS